MNPPTRLAPSGLSCIPCLRPILAALALLAAGCANTAGDAGGTPASSPADGRPGLVVLVSVDQLTPDLLERYEAFWSGGFRRLLDSGRVFESAAHAHAYTETAPGHATLATGVVPARHGIVANDWREQGPGGEIRSMYSVEDADAPVLGVPEATGRSPENLLRPGLGEWIREADPEARVVSISRKDRAAITLAGRTPGAHVYWLSDRRGRFVTSEWYRDRYPGWVERANREVVAGIFADTVWESSVPREAAALTRADTAAREGVGGIHSHFPHRAMAELDDPSPSDIHDWVIHTPAPDSAVLALAVEAIEALGLGRRGGTDFLAVGFSQVDYVGHRFGPMSREQLDNLLHLDRMLGHLISALDRQVGPDGWVMAFTADHGVLPYPEWLAARGRWAVRLSDEEERAFRDALEAAGSGARSPGELRERLVTAAESFDFVARAYTHPEILASTEQPADSFIPLYRNNLREDRSGGLLSSYGVEVRYRPGVLTAHPTLGTTHGSPYWYDRHVPLVFLGTDVAGGVTSEAAHTYDVAPTLSGLAGIPVPDDLDGKDLSPLFGRR